jgi:hypothetical protein
MRVIAKQFGVGPGTVQRISRPLLRGSDYRYLRDGPLLSKGLKAPQLCSC